MENTNIPCTAFHQLLILRPSILNNRLYPIYRPVIKAFVLILPCTITSKVMCYNQNAISVSSVCLASNARIMSESAQYCTVQHFEVKGGEDEMNCEFKIFLWL